MSERAPTRVRNNKFQKTQGERHHEISNPSSLVHPCLCYVHHFIQLLWPEDAILHVEYVE